MIRMSLKVPYCTSLLLLGGCVASGYTARLEALDRLAEQEVDGTLDFIEKRYCSLPIDIIARRAGQKGPQWTRAYFTLCPDLRLLLADAASDLP